MSIGNNDNETETVVRTSNYNDNYNDNGNNVKKDKYELSKRVERTADEIIRRLGVDQIYRGFYCKVAYSLSEARIWSNMESAKKGRQPARLFSYLCKRDM